MLTMTPCPFLSLCAKMACMPYNVPFTLRSKVFSNDASSISRNFARRIAAPAELNQNCTAAGTEIVIEEFLAGEEASFSALCNRVTAIPLAAAQDHNRAFDGDQGPNTCGMGACSSAPNVDAAMSACVMEEIMLPTCARWQRSVRRTREPLTPN
jgi:phosphoribosylamine-glycine ligase